MKYLCSDKKDEARVKEALGRLASDSDWRYVCEKLLESTVARTDKVVRDMPHDDPQLPVYQGVARGIQELITLSMAVRTPGQQQAKSRTPNPIM